MLEVVLDHFREYKTPPSKDVLKVKVTEIDNDVLKTAILEQLKEVFRFMESDDLTFVKDEILKTSKSVRQYIDDTTKNEGAKNFYSLKFMKKTIEYCNYHKIKVTEEYKSKYNSLKDLH